MGCVESDFQEVRRPKKNKQKTKTRLTSKHKIEDIEMIPDEERRNRE